MAYQKNNKLIAGISFRPEILAYVDASAKEDERSRSDYVNRLIKEDARRKGVDLAAFAAAADEQNVSQPQQAA